MFYTRGLYRRFSRIALCTQIRTHARIPKYSYITMKLAMSHNSVVAKKGIKAAPWIISLEKTQTPVQANTSRHNARSEKRRASDVRRNCYANHVNCSSSRHLHQITTNIVTEIILCDFVIYFVNDSIFDIFLDEFDNAKWQYIYRCKFYYFSFNALYFTKIFLILGIS